MKNIQKNTQIPIPLQASKDVTEAEYVRANRENVLLWIFTIIIAFIPVVLILLLSGPNIYDVLFIGIGGGVGAGLIVHIVMKKAIFTEAHKAGTMRLQKYPELKKWKQMVGETEHEQVD